MKAVVAIAAVVVSGLVGAGVGAVAGYAGTERHGPSAPPAFDDDFPSNAMRYLPGVTTDIVARRWAKEANDWVCGPDQDIKPDAEAKQRMECEPDNEQKYDVYVDVSYDDDTHIRSITVNCDYRPGSTMCKTLFAAVADALLIPQQNLRKQGADWAAQNADTDRAKAIGGIRFGVELSPHRMRCTPAA